LEVPNVIDLRLSTFPPYSLITSIRSAFNLEPLTGVGGTQLALWGNPASPVHDTERGNCATGLKDDCPVDIPQRPFLTLPRSCSGPLLTTYAADSWEEPGVFLPGGEPDFDQPGWATGYSESHDGAVPPAPLGQGGCARLAFKPTIQAKPTTLSASSPTGLDFTLDLKDEGLQHPEGLAAPEARKAVITLPEGFTVNPSLAEGLEACTEAGLARETAFSAPGAGCPDASKVGTAEARSPLLEGGLRGSLYVATPYENPLGSLLALYLVLKNPRLGVAIVQPLEVEADPVSGRLVTVAEELPQVPFSSLALHFREGTRSPLASPPRCGTYEAAAELYPWSGTLPVSTTSAFQIITGPDGDPCPSGGLPPFKPGLVAGTINNAAGRFSPFNVGMSRTDSEQEITRFSIKLPPGVAGKLAGIPYCPEQAVAAAKARSGPRGGAEELRRPSCPAASLVGRTLAGFGVGPALAYAPGKLYMAGPYRGSLLSLVSVTAGVIGPFDLGTVVTREAFRVDPETAEVFIDATGSDPIPHIVKGIPLHLRDIRAYADRPGFVLNPTSCKRTSTASTLLGSGLDFGSEADDRPVTVSTPFQAADCAALPFKPRLFLKLKGGTRRGDHPAFTATLRMNGIGEAGIKSAQLTLPRSEFIANSHFKTICTRAQFRAGAHPGEGCPPGSIYGTAMASTPLLEQPLGGPVFLRSSEQKLPDVVAALRNGQAGIVLAGKVDSVKGRLRVSFEQLPDAPVRSVSFSLAGKAKGLFENSTGLCRATHRAVASFSAQNGKRHGFSPPLKATGCKAPGAGHKRQKAAKR
jgi:hypothetical protein